MRLRVVVLSLVVAACGGPLSADPPGVTLPMAGDGQAVAEDTPLATDDIPVTWAGFSASRIGSPTLAAYAFGEVDVYESVDANEPMLTLEPTTILGTTTVLGVVGEPAGDRVEVLVPTRPNGLTGWVSTEEVGLFVVDGEVVIDLSERALTYYLNGEQVLTTTVGVGSPHNPTPTGRFFVTDSVALSDATSPWGPYALGLSARSETITEFNGGDGIIGIHGTNNPDSIGQDISLGCVRLPNDMIEALYRMTPIGTPVTIQA